MTLTGQRAALVALLESITGIGGGLGIVHARRRIIRSEGAIKTLLVGTAPAVPGQVNAWMISPAATATTVSERHPGFNAIGGKGGGQVLTTMQWQIEGYGQVDDAAGSEATFHDLGWAVANELNQYGALSIPGVIQQLPADIEQFGFIFLAGLALYHYCRIGVAFQGRTVGA